MKSERSSKRIAKKLSDEIEEPQKRRKISGEKTKKIKKAKEEEQEQSIEEYPNQLSDFISNDETISKLRERGINYLFPIQERTFNFIINGEDLIGKDRTGSGKTLSYALPLTEKMRAEGLFNQNKRGQKPYLLCVLPTRELCIQVWKEFKALCHGTEYRTFAVYGGTELRQQIYDIKDGVEIVVGTPGRLIDMMNREVLQMSNLKTIVLDEVDQMLDLGFKDDMEKIYNFIQQQKQEKIQNLLFSATIPSWVDEISRKYVDPKRQFIDLIKGSTMKTSTTVKHYAVNCPFHQRVVIMGDIILCYGGHHGRTIVFTETKQEANDILLKSQINTDAQVMHGDIPQKQREITFQGFRDGKFKCLIATNVVARGLDIPEVDLIIQLDPPKDVETYIHRSGRTARAGRKGACVVFYGKKNLFNLERIEKKANIKFKRIGAPQPLDIIKASAKDISKGLNTVSEEIIPHFKETAEKLILELGAEEALSRALAYLSGYTQNFKSRSLLCAIEGFVTFIAHTQQEFRTLGYVWGFLRNNFPGDLVESIRGMKPIKGRLGAVFDLPEQHVQILMSYIEREKDNQNSINLEKAQSIPELEEEFGDNSFNRNGFNDRNQGGYGNNQRGGYQRNNGFQNNRGDRQRNQRFGDKELELFIGGLPYDADENTIQQSFERAGVPVSRVKILYDEQQNSKGIAFAFSNSKEDLERTLQSRVYVGHKVVRIKKAGDRS